MYYTSVWWSWSYIPTVPGLIKFVMWWLLIKALRFYFQSLVYKMSYENASFFAYQVHVTGMPLVKVKFTCMQSWFSNFVFTEPPAKLQFLKIMWITMYSILNFYSILTVLSFSVLCYFQLRAKRKQVQKLPLLSQHYKGKYIIIFNWRGKFCKWSPIMFWKGLFWLAHW